MFGNFVLASGMSTVLNAMQCSRSIAKDRALSVHNEGRGRPYDQNWLNSLCETNADLHKFGVPVSLMQNHAWWLSRNCCVANSTYVTPPT